MTGLLASVRNLAEANMALQGGADIVDLKDPAKGALGALMPSDAKAIVENLAGRVPVSATIGDLPTEAMVLSHAVRATVATGVDFVKIGIFSERDLGACLKALSPFARHTRLIAVLFADLGLNLRRILPVLRATGFAGVMIDTAKKTAGGLRLWLSREELAAFLAQARRLDLMTGLAGSLKAQDIPALLELEPDYLGFRTALCSAANRTQSLDAAALADLRVRIPACAKTRSYLSTGIPAASRELQPVT
jgi:(5-formylfuran-3-yl)methyl phosphate synthase